MKSPEPEKGRNSVSHLLYRTPSLFYSFYLHKVLGQFTRNYTQTVKRAADNKRRYADGKSHDAKRRTRKLCPPRPWLLVPPGRYRFTYATVRQRDCVRLYATGQ